MTDQEIDYLKDDLAKAMDHLHDVEYAELDGRTTDPFAHSVELEKARKRVDELRTELADAITGDA